MGGQDHGRTRSWEDKIMGGHHYDDVKNDDVNTDAQTRKKSHELRSGD